MYLMETADAFDFNTLRFNTYIKGNRINTNLVEGIRPKLL